MVLTLLWACGGLEDSAAFGSCPTERPPTWNTFGHGFVTTYCLACHSEGNTDRRYGAPDGMDFDTEEQVRLYAERLRVRVIEEETMPVGGGVYADDLLVFEHYLNCIAP